MTEKLTTTINSKGELLDAYYDFTQNADKSEFKIYTSESETVLKYPTKTDVDNILKNIEKTVNEATKMENLNNYTATLIAGAVYGGAESVDTRFNTPQEEVYIIELFENIEKYTMTGKSLTIKIHGFTPGREPININKDIIKEKNNNNADYPNIKKWYLIKITFEWE